MQSNDLSKRLLQFSVRTIKYIRTLPKGQEYQVISYQLIKSSTSVGANYKEAQAGSSKADFHNKVKISLKEIMETRYWFKILNEIITSKQNVELDFLINESEELSKILGSIANKTKKR